MLHGATDSVAAGVRAQLGAGADVVLCTGGLGPTVDDLTTEVAADLLGVELRLDEDAIAHMEERWRTRGRATN